MNRVFASMMVCVGLLSAGCEKTTVQGPAGKSLTLVKPINSTIKQGDNEKVSILVKRSNFSDPVTVTFNNLPSGVSVAGGDNKMEGSERTFVLSATDSAALVENHTASVTVTGPDGMSATEQFSITIRSKT